VHEFNATANTRPALAPFKGHQKSELVICAGSKGGTCHSAVETEGVGVVSEAIEVAEVEAEVDTNQIMALQRKCSVCISIAWTENH
jgi:hypothetical protein